MRLNPLARDRPTADSTHPTVATREPYPSGRDPQTEGDRHETLPDPRPRVFRDEIIFPAPPPITNVTGLYRDGRSPRPGLDFQQLQLRPQNSSQTTTTSSHRAPPPPPPPRRKVSEEVRSAVRQQPQDGPQKKVLVETQQKSQLQAPPNIPAQSYQAQQSLFYQEEDKSDKTLVAQIRPVDPGMQPHIRNNPEYPGQERTKPNLPSKSGLIPPLKRHPTPDLVRDSKLNTVFSDDDSTVRHISYMSNPAMRQRRTMKEEIWRRVRDLDSGAFGRVFLEELTNSNEAGKLRAVKEITKTQHGNNKEIDYTRELEAIAKFSHEKYVHCFVQSFGWYESPNEIFITMEYASKGSLQKYLMIQLPEEEVKQIIYQLLEGLYFMHQNSFAHRDLKPANVLVFESSPEWWVKISDFGISKRAEEGLTQFHTVVGTKGYLAPELTGTYCADMEYADSSEDSSIYTDAVDLWALGAIMYKLLTNQHIFNNPRDLGLYCAAKQPFPSHLISEKGASAACISFLTDLMAPSPRRRPSADQALQHAWLSELHTPIRQLEESLTSVTISSTTQAKAPSCIEESSSYASAAWPSHLF